MKYDQQIIELKNLLPTAKNILIATSAGADIDKLAAGLALFLTFETAGKQVSIASDDNILVGHTHLFGVDHVQKTLPQTEGGNLTLVLEGVAASDNTVPALEKLDWYAENSNLNLVFHVAPGQTFQPAKIIPKYQGSGFNLIFTVGAVNLNALGNIYSANIQAFSGTHIVNVDTQSANTSFGQTNVLDSQASSVSEVMVNLLSDLGFAMDADTASNLLAGIFEATKDLTDTKVTADTYMAVANCLRVGGRKPQALDTTAPTNSGLDLSALIPKTQAQTVSDFTAPSQPPMDAGDHIQPIQQAAQSSPPIQSGSPEERPMGERVISETVEPEWLTPKIFKGSSIG
ncbi:MAG: Uncharacterized protein G01um10147_561 [Microgenomates group bacterium Gr01-1014_7]|nr:MAG: Uncharacterized protein G01um10147_561 [Microgenomates group bacterium Gr01-1014_7]